MNNLKEIILRNINNKDIVKFKTMGELKVYFRNNKIITNYITLNQKYISEEQECPLIRFFIEQWEITFIYKKKQNKKKKGNGQGSIYFDNTRQCWAGQYTYNGKRKPPICQRKAENKTQFIARFNEILASISNGTYIEKSKDTLYNILKRHIEQKYKDGLTKDRAYNRNLATLQAIEKTCSNFINKPIQDISVEDIEDAKSEIKKYSKTVIDKIWSMLQKGFKIAIARRKVLFNVMDDETLTKPISEKPFEKVTALTEQEEKKLNDILDNEEKNHKYRNIVKLELLTGMRIGEVLSRSLDDITEGGKFLHIHNTLTQDKDGVIILGEHTKTYNKTTGIDNGVRDFPINSEIQEIINEQKSTKITNIYKLLFWDYKNNTFITPQEVNSWLHRINKKYEISKKLHNHKLRHTRITRWKEQGMDLNAIQYFAGHVEGSSITNDVYIDISKEYALKELKKTNKKSTA